MAGRAKKHDAYKCLWDLTTTHEGKKKCLETRLLGTEENIDVPSSEAAVI